jgi:hypothetical protein
MAENHRERLQALCGILLAAAFLAQAGPAAAQDILFEESFDDNNFESRDWYDTTGGDISTTEHIDGSAGSFECTYPAGETGCRGGGPGRHLFTESESLYVGYWVKYSANWEGSNRSYHPHEIYFVTNLDDIWVGPAITHLTGYIEQNEGTPRLALQDSSNNDMGCILLNDDSFVGCDGNFDTYAFSEARSACACNGIVGDLDGRDCFLYADGVYYSARFWDAPGVYFSDEAGPRYKNDWHHVEVLFQMNGIQDGVGIPDGILRYWYDGELVLEYTRILMRTGQHPEMRFNQFLLGPYIGDGSPVEQTMWIDNLVVATGRPGEPPPDDDAEAPPDTAPDTAPDGTVDPAPDAAPDGTTDPAVDAAPDLPADVPSEEGQEDGGGGGCGCTLAR